MEIFGGFMVMMSILGLFLAVIWFVMPFVVFAVKGRVERAVILLESVDQRLARLEERLAAAENGAEAGREKAVSPSDSPATEGE
ncbi:hypothetical protein [Geobacter sp.]|uniref:hypothetical protein n=1 Tax=Geobacter sp. TaxID=46610 RepID=UPI00261669D4|nr:hypothetical protein [Geobacter sp.]